MDREREIENTCHLFHHTAGVGNGALLSDWVQDTLEIRIVVPVQVAAVVITDTTAL